MIEQNEHDTPMHKWERIEAQLERVWSELKESNATNLVLQRSQMDLCQERDQWRAVAEELASGLRIWHDSDIGSKHPAIAAYENLKGE